MQQEQLNVRGVDRSLWRSLRIESVRRGVTVASLLNEAIREWLRRHAQEAVA